MDNRYVATLCAAMCIIPLVQLTRADMQEICNAETFEGRCESGQVMAMKSARYGRMRLGRCVKVDLGYLGCASDVLPLFDGWCSGKPSCKFSFNNANEDLVAKRTCIADVMSYLEVDFTCVSVTSPADASCRSVEEVPLTSSRSTLSNHVTDETGCGSLNVPWVIRTSPGQRISVAMTDFGWSEDEDISSRSKCQPYGYISEPGLGVNKTLCGGQARERPVYMSSSNHLIIQLLRRGERELTSSFLINYSVIGCPDMTPPAHAWYKRNGSTAVIGCEWTEHSWHLRCDANNWVGVVGNCSSGVAVTEDSAQSQWSMSPLLSVSLIIGLGVLVVALFCIALIGCICIIGSTRKRNQSEAEIFQPTDQQQAFLYHPGRALPGPHTGQMTVENNVWIRGGDPTLRPTKPTTTDELIHIWETPLPIPKQAQSSNGGADTSTTMSDRGTLPGPPQVYKDGSTMSRSDYSTDTYWAGTDRYFDNDLGWVTVPKKE